MNALYSEMLERVEQEIKQLQLPSQPNLLYEPINYIMSLGGKRVRPILTMLGCELFGTPYERAVKQAMAIEMFHNFTLVHDDVMDSAEVRRKLPTVHKKWDHNVALLSGDGMLVLAYQKLFQAPDNLLRALGDTFSKAAIEVCEGQQLDMDYANRDNVSLAEYTEMIRLKTAVLLTASLQIGAIMGGAGADKMTALQSFAESIGLAFQLRDDYLDAFGSADFGKAIGGDIMEGKRTWLTIKALEIGDQQSKERLLAAYKSTDLSSRVEIVMSEYRNLGIGELAQEEVNRYSQVAINSLQTLGGDSRARETLNWLVEQLIGRTA